MRVSVSKRAISFVGSDEPVARTVASGEGVLLDLAADGRVIALELHEQGKHDIVELAKQHPDLENFLDEIRVMFDEMERERTRKLSHRQNRRLREVARDFAHHAHA